VGGNFLEAGSVTKKVWPNTKADEVMVALFVVIFSKEVEFLFIYLFIFFMLFLKEMHCKLLEKLLRILLIFGICHFIESIQHELQGIRTSIIVFVPRECGLV
jgi:hypothetical protein